VFKLGYCSFELKSVLIKSIRLLLAGEALVLFLDKKNQNQVTSLCFSATQGLYPAKPGSTTAVYILPLAIHHWYSLSGKI
jgi:hypothetical protein